MSYKDDIYLLVSNIPSGYVMSYSSIAKHVGCHARHVGYAMSNCPDGLPWHRVINSQGKISLPQPHYDRQREILLSEGVLFSKHDKIDLTKYLWQPPEFFFSDESLRP